MSAQTFSRGTAIRRLVDTRGVAGRRAASSGLQPAQVAHQEQVLQMAADRSEALEVLDRFLPACLAARAKRRTDDLLERARLPVDRASKYPQVSPPHAKPRQLGRGADDLEIRLVVARPALAAIGLHDAVLLELAKQALWHAGLVQKLLLRHHRHGRIDGGRPPRGRRLCPAPGRGQLSTRELLTDHPEGKELVALHPQDRAKTLHIRLAVQAIPAGGASGGEQLLVLEVTDLRDRDVVELLTEDLRHRADGQRLARPRCPLDLRPVVARLARLLLACGCNLHLSAPGSSACICRSGSRPHAPAGATRSADG